jgi:hypothetical protein
MDMLPEEKLDAEAAAAAASEGSIQIAKRPDEQELDESKKNIELGDDVIITTKNIGKIAGRVYYKDEDLLSIKENNGSNVLRDFPLDDTGKLDSETVESYEITDNGKRTVPSFVEQQNMMAGQIMYTFTPDGLINKDSAYIINTVNPETDTITYVDNEEKEYTINFNFTGIPRDLPFRVIATAEKPLEDQGEAESASASADAADEADESKSVAELEEEEELAESADADDNEIDFVIVGTVKMPLIIDIEAIPSNEQIYSDSIQKADLLTDLMKDMPDIKKKNGYQLRKLRTQTEMFFALRNELLEYSQDGAYIEQKPTSVDTLSQLFQITDVPLGRPVLDVVQHFYLLNRPPDNDGNIVWNTPTYNNSVKFRDYEDYLQYMKEQTNIQKSGRDMSTDERVVSFWPWLQSFHETVMRPWDPAYQSDNFWYAKQDSEFFRKEIPDIDMLEEDEADDGAALHHGDNYIRAVEVEPLEDKKFGRGTKKEITEATMSVKRIGISVGRALGPIYRSDDKKKNILLRGGEIAPINNFIIFPLGATPYMGNIRSGLLARDVEYAQRAIMTIKQLIRFYDGITDTPTSNTIFALNTDGKSYGNITLADYFDGISFTGLGMGSFDFILRQFGLHRFELNPDMRAILVKKMAQTQNALIKYINRIRKELKEHNDAGKNQIVDRLVGAPLEVGANEEVISIIETARTAPLLLRVIEEFKNKMQNFTNSDIGQVIALLNEYPDFFTAAVGDVPQIYAKEELYATRVNFAKTIETEIRKKLHELNKGQKPTPNPCQHVSLLRDIRRGTDDNQRMMNLINFVSKFQGKRDENWIDCAKCNQHLLCVHELLQIKQFMNPREREPLLKEIYLRFNGPLVGGHYQCRNCCQPIAELDFDKNLEFDDEGNPMSGRAVLVDKDAARQEELEQALMDPTAAKEGEEPLTFTSRTQTEIYEIARLIAEKVGIFPKRDSYIRIVDGVQRMLATKDNRSKYTRKLDKLRKDKPAEAAKYPEYDVRCSRLLIAGAAAYVLLEIQTAIPIYIPRYFIPGCAPAGFSGYPLSGDIENRIGINYLACAVSAIRKGGRADYICELPTPSKLTAWELTGWQSVASDKGRIEQIASLITKIFTDNIVNDATVQHSIALKNQYLRDTYGANKDTGDIAKDQIPSNFMPEQIILKKDDAAEPIVAEAVKDQRLLANLYIKTAHKFARETAKLYQGSPFAETICCPAPLSDPLAFWKSKTDLPQLPPRILQQGRKGSRITVHFTPRPLASLLVDASPNIYYRVFLQLCASGPNIGRIHEFGFTHKCAQCGFQMPASLLLVKDYIEQTGISKGDEKKVRQQREDQLAAAEREANELFIKQGININKDSFQNLLNASHLSNEVVPYELPEVKSNLDRISKLAEPDFPPVENWQLILQTFIDKISGLGIDADKSDYAEHLDMISQMLDISVKEIRRRIKQQSTDFFVSKMYTTESDGFDLNTFLEAITSYFIVPYQRINNGVPVDANIFVQRSYNLHTDHVDKIKTHILEPSEIVRKQLLDNYLNEANVFAIAKLNYFVAQIAEACSLLKTVNARNFPGGNYTLMYIAQVMFFKPLADFLNPNEIPEMIREAADDSGEIDLSAKINIDLVKKTLAQFKFEYIGLSPEEIKTELRIRAEKETDGIISRISNMSDNEKEIEMINKTLRIGNYAVGGSQAIYKYDSEQYAIEALQRMSAGIDDFAVPTGEEFAVLYGDERQGQRRSGAEEGYGVAMNEDDF